MLNCRRLSCTVSNKRAFLRTIRLYFDHSNIDAKLLALLILTGYGFNFFNAGIIYFHSSPPYSPVLGGLWEAEIKSI